MMSYICLIYGNSGVFITTDYFSFQPSVDRKVIDDLITMRFIHNNENVVFLGPPGVGKTHLSVALDISRYFSANRDFNGIVRVFFQPAEESPPGGVSTPIENSPKSP